MRNKTNKMSTKKKVSAVMAAVLIIALLTGGAFAWTEFRQSITNRFRGGGDNDVLLHDDFEPGVNKDVYVENTGENPLIVRVMFKEYFQIGNESILGGNSKDKTSWSTHYFDQVYDPADCGLASHEYFEWVLSGEKKAYKPGTGEAGNKVIKVDDKFPDGSVAKNTLDYNPPITMAEYMSDRTEYDGEKNGRWILDEDGWAYWSKLLPKDEATNLLLDNVIIKSEPDDNYYYAIDVILQASNRTEAQDIIKSKEGVTGDAKELIEYLAGQSGKPSANPGIKVKEGTATTVYTEGDTFITEGLVLIVTREDGEKEDVTSGFTVTPNGQLSTTDKFVTIEYEGMEVKLPIKVNPTPVEDTALELKAPYDVEPIYTPPANTNYRIRFREDGAGSKIYVFSTGANREVGLPLEDIIDGNTTGIKITRVRINSASRDVDITDPQEIEDYKVYITAEGKLAASFLPTYAELTSTGNIAGEDTCWDVQVPVIVTLSNADGTKTCDFTINVMYMGSATIDEEEGE